MTDQVGSLLADRNKEYADAWKLEGTVLTNMTILPQLSLLASVFPEAWFPWVIILNKLLRALGSPRNVDHWRDMAGYATLVVNHLDSVSVTEAKDGSNVQGK